MTDDRFKTQFYEPYLAAWKIIKSIQHIDEQDREQDWKNYTAALNKLVKDFPDNDFIQSLVQLLIDAADYISKENLGARDTGAYKEVGEIGS